MIACAARTPESLETIGLVISMCAALGISDDGTLSPQSWPRRLANFLQRPRGLPPELAFRANLHEKT